MRKMFERLRQFKLYAKLLKHFSIIQMIEFFEYLINNHEILISLHKIKIIQTWLKFKTLHELRIFLKFTNFYKRFRKFYIKITRTLTKLFKKSK